MGSRTIPDVIFQVNDTIGAKIAWYLGTEPIRALLNSSISEYIAEEVEIYHGHDVVVPHFPNIVIESVSERDVRIAADVMTAYHTYNIIPQIRRTQRLPSERSIRRLATATKQCMYNLLSFQIDLENGFKCMVWDADQPVQITYGYRQAKTVRAAIIPWTYKIDIPLHLMYVGQRRIDDAEYTSEAGNVI